MARLAGHRVRETTTAPGTGTATLNGATFGFLAFEDQLTSGDEVYYLLENFDDLDDPSTGDWEAGIGTLTLGASDTLSRDTVIASSNGGAKVNFSSGSVRVHSCHPNTGFLIASNNLSDVGSAATSRTNLGLGDVATHTMGSGNNLDADMLDGIHASELWQLTAAETISGANTYSGAQSFSGDNDFTGNADFSGATLVVPVGADKYGTGPANGSLWVEGDYLHYISDEDTSEWQVLGDFVANQASAVPGSVWLDTSDYHIHYIDADNDERDCPRGTPAKGIDPHNDEMHGDGQALIGSTWVEESLVRFIMSEGAERVIHEDAAHTDTHYDTHYDQASYNDHVDGSHADSHSDVTHVDSHTDTHSDVPHADSHGDAHTDWHQDETLHWDTHDDEGPPHQDYYDYQDYYTDSHTDTHSDSHTDSYSDSHSDTPHSDYHSDDTHGDHDDDIPHTDSYTDSHGDTEHGDQPTEVV